MSQPFIIKFSKKLTSSRSDLDEVRRWFKKVLRIKKKKKRKFKLILKKPILVGFVLFLIIAGVFCFLFSPSQAIAEWWNTNWHYRQAITVTNSGSAQTNFQVKILDDYDMSAEVSAGKVQADFADLRFTNANGQSLDYWIEDDTPTSLDVWARIPSISAGESIVYMYYGNSSAGSGKVKIGTSSFPGLSCKAILDAGDSDGDGVYWIDPSNGDFSDKFQAYCDMTTDGGGWTLVEKDYGGSNVVPQSSVDDTNTSILLDNSWSDEEGKFSDVKMKALFGELLWKKSTGEYVKMRYTDDFIDNYWFSNFYYANRPSGVFQEYYRYLDSTWYAINGHTNNWHYSNYNDGMGSPPFSNDRSARDQNDNLVYWPTRSNGLMDNTSFRFHIFLRNSHTTTDFLTTLSSEEVGPGPVAYWSFDEGYGTTALDKTSNANHGTLYSQTASWQDESMCISGKCVYFNGESSTWNTVRVDNDPSLDGMDSLTVSVWVKLVEAKSHQIIYKRQDGGSPAWYAYYIGVNSSNRIEFRVSNASGPVTAYTSNNVISLNKWHHIIAVYNGSNLQVYVDGVAAVGSPPPLSGKVLSSTGTLQIGGLDGSSITHGFIDEPKIYPYARTEAQILADYNAHGGATSKGSAVSFGGQTSTGGLTSLSDGLVGYWKMDEASGNVIDASGNGNTGTPTGTTVTAGKYGNARSFNGSSDYVSVSHGDLTDITSAYTISGWMFLSPSTWAEDGYFYWKGYGAGGSGYSLWMHSSSKVINIGFGNSGTWANTGYSMPTSEWKHVTVINDGTTNGAKLYIDGSLVYSCTRDLPSSDANNLNIGARSNGSARWFNGTIDEVRIYNRALSEHEVRQLYEYAPGPIAYYNFDEGSGTNLYDKSGNENNSTSFVGSPTWVQGKYGGALEFDGENDYINIGSPMNNVKEFSISTWIKTTQQETNSTPYRIPAIIGVQHGSGYVTNDFVLNNDNGNLGWWDEFNGAYKAKYDSGYFISDGNWHHVAANRSIEGSNSIIDLYVDGVKIGSTTSVGTGAIEKPIRIAYSYDNYTYIDGQLDDTRIYNYARTQKQILEDMNAGRPAQKTPIAHWKFDKGYGTTAYDSGLGGNDGTITGASWTNEGMLGKALSFNGTSDYVSCGSVGQSESFSLGTWLFPTSIPSYDNDGYFYAKSGDSYLRFSLSQNNLSSNVRWRLPGGSYTSYYLSENNSINEWVYINVVYDGLNNILKGYKNGELQNIYNDVDIYGDFGQNLEIGRNPTNSAYYTGLIDDVKIWNYPLTEEEIKTEYNQGKAGVIGAPSSDTTGGGHSSAFEYCVPGDDSYCAPPVGEWKFDEKTGNTVYDTSGNNNHGTINGMLPGQETWTIGKIGAALKFDGSDDYVAFSSPTVGANDLTVSFWMKPSSLSQETVLGNISTYTRMVQIEDNNTVEFNLGVGHNYFDIDTNFLVDQWQYVTITKVSSGAVKIYLDGKDVTLGSPVISDANDINWNRMGREKETNLVFSGALDHIKIYDYARTPAQIAWEYNKGKPIAHWRFDEGQGATLYDSSGNENHGTLNLGASGQTSPGSVKVSGNTAWYNGREGKQNYSLSFDGNDDYGVLISNIENLLGTNPSEWSYSAWFKTNGTISSKSEIISNYDSASGGDSLVGLWTGINADGNTGRIFINVRGSGAPDYLYTPSGTRYDDSSWHHILVTAQKNDYVKGYIDGVKFTSDSSSSLGSTDYIDTTPVRIGTLRYNGNFQEFFNGQIDEVKIFNYALSADQVKTVYNLGAARFGTGN